MKPDELTDAAIDYIFDNYDGRNLSKWELSFMESVQDQWQDRRRLSERQKEILEQIWDKQP